MSYVFEDEHEREAVRNLTQEQRMKLRMYELHLQEKRADKKEREDLIMYMVINNLDAGLIKHL